ncbi:hypothetical protein F4677DRAFT_464403 [Hypoxylon crocopeplum]|nr:hypothetical protein F4677DRAFT_464403 [Hypoxylon crocopeplum]
MSTASLPGADQPDKNRGPDILGAVVSTTLVALIAVCARLFVRIRMIRSTGTDDYVMLAAMIISLSGMGVIIVEVHYGAGRHVAYLDPEVNKFGLKLNFISQPLYLVSISMVKMSIGLFLIRINSSIYYKRIVLGVILFLIAYTLACFATLMLQCSNLAILWDSSIQATCWSQSTLQGLSYANSTVNVTTDLFFALLPIPMLWNVKIKTRIKISLFCVLGLGIFASAASIVKTVYLTNYGKTGDVLWDSANLTIWNVVEANTGITAACLPCIKPMLKPIFGSSLRYGSPRMNNGYNLRACGHGIDPKGSKFSSSQSRTEIGAQSVAVPSILADTISNASMLTHRPGEITRTTVITIDRGTDEQGEGSGWQNDYQRQTV